MGDMERIQRMFEQIDGNVKGMNEKLDFVMREIKEMKEENKNLRERVVKQEERIQHLEREVRKKNLIIKGIVDGEGEDENETRDKIVAVVQKIGVDIDVKGDVDEVRRIGKYRPQQKRPILVKLTKESTRRTVLKNAKKLKGTDIWIDEDYPREVQEERRRLMPRMKEARENGCKAIVKYNKLIINGEVHTAEQLEEGREVERMSEFGSGSNSLKRTVLERSPEGDKFEEQLRKISRTTRKN